MKSSIRCVLVFLLVGLFYAERNSLGQDPEPGKQIACVFRYEVDGEKKDLRYNLFVPKDYDQDKKFPLMLFLHGAGERGDDLEKVKSWGPPKIVGKKNDFPFIVISPQCPRSDWWTRRVEGLAQLVKDASKRLKVDTQRVYCTGLSMGGFGTWALCAKYPKLFAAAAPICGGGEVESGKLLKDLPIWAFHGDADKVVKVEKSKEMVDAIKAAGGKKVKLTLYEGVGHNSWSKAYADKKLYDWFLMHRKQP